MTIAPFPHKYTVDLERDMMLAGARAPILIGAPSQFGGTDDVWSPEHLFIGAALACLQTTFFAFAAREGIKIFNWRGTGKGTLVKTAGGPVFESIELDVDIVTDAANTERAQALLQKAERHCIISRAIAAPVHVTGRVTSALAA